jgi:isoquinoline 1-oxidoreductase beta subunit
VLERAAAEAGWGRPLDGRARGAAVYYAHGGWAAQIAEVSVDANGRIRVHRVVCAVDCGFAVNPDTLAAQIEGGIAFGLTAALKSKITLDHGRVEQTGFRDYPLLTIAEMPLVEVHVVASGEDPTGAGECGVPPIAPAVANAVFAATGRRLRSLPLRL